MSFLAVTGTFSNNPTEIKASKLSAEIVGAMASAMHVNPLHVNGGDLNELNRLMETTIKVASVILWMPNISNDEDKFLPRIKELNPHCLLISSKRAIEKDYTEQDVVGRLLKSRSALGIMITQHERVYQFQVLDPLGNQWGYKTPYASVAGQYLGWRVMQLRHRTRIGSERIGDTRPFDIDPFFLGIVRDYGAAFHNYLNAVNPNRLLGNAATRCMSGFPATIQEERIFVSRRNIDKQGIGLDGFVEVEPFTGSDPDDLEVVRYYGDNKPSVDTPPQLLLFAKYPNVRYMVHGHTYIQGAPYTASALPCGSVEEVEEILTMFPNQQDTNMVLNLRGHGFLIMADSIDFLVGCMPRMRSRPMPEVQDA